MGKIMKERSVRLLRTDTEDTWLRSYSEILRKNVQTLNLELDPNNYLLEERVEQE